MGGDFRLWNKGICFMILYALNDLSEHKNARSYTYQRLLHSIDVYFYIPKCHLKLPKWQDAKSISVESFGQDDS